MRACVEVGSQAVFYNHGLHLKQCYLFYKQLAVPSPLPSHPPPPSLRKSVDTWTQRCMQG